VVVVSSSKSSASSGGGDDNQTDAPDGEHIHPLCGVSCDLEPNKHETVTWTAWTSPNSLPDNPDTYYYLTNDVSLIGMQSINKGVNLCLNGHTISVIDDNNGYIAAIYISPNITFRMTNCKGETGGLVNKDNVIRRGVYIDKGATLYLYGGKISGWRDNYGGAGIDNDGVLYIYGGAITDNAIVDSVNTNDGGGAGILNTPNGIIYMLGGSILRNIDTGKNGGGGVKNHGFFYIENGTISENQASAGGGIYTIGILQLSGNELVKNNKSTVYLNLEDNIFYLNGQTQVDTQPTAPTKDSEPKTGDKTPPLATLGMIAGLAYLMDYFAEKKGVCLGMTKAQKDKLISFLVGKAKGKSKFIRMSMLSVIFLILVFYHSIGKIVEVDGLEMNCK
jgi:hypothetical protein